MVAFFGTPGFGIAVPIPHGYPTGVPQPSFGGFPNATLAHGGLPATYAGPGGLPGFAAACEAFRSQSAMPGTMASGGEGEKEVLSKPRILCYGDSLTAGLHDNGRRFSPYGDALREGLASLGFQCDVSICGLSGFRTDQMIAELNSPMCQDGFGKFGKGLAHILENDGHYDLVILMAGTNDFTPNSDLKAIQSRICKLHKTCHVRGVPTVMLAAPCNTSSLRIGLSQILGAWAQIQSQVLAFVDPEELIPRRNAAHWEQDSVHFTPSGSRTLGLQLSRQIAQFLQKLGQDPEESMQLPQVQHIPSYSKGFHKMVSPRSHQWMPLGAQATPRYMSRGGA